MAGLGEEHVIEAHGECDSAGGAGGGGCCAKPMMEVEWRLSKGADGRTGVRTGAGSFEAATCLRCKKEYTKEAIRPQIMRGEVVYCDERRCKGKEDALVSCLPTCPLWRALRSGLPGRAAGAPLLT